MKNIKKIISLILCLILFTFMCTTAFAAAAPGIKISNEAAMAGQEVTVSVTLSGNPGIMAMTFSIVYDNSQFEFIDVTKGFTSTPTYKDHSDKGYVAFSISETSDITTSGTLMSLKFKIKDSAKPGKYPINIGNPNYEKYGKKIDNCFSNSKEDLIVPTVTTGSITVESECDRTGHNYGGWEVVKQSNCTETGLKTRTCSRCGGVEEIILDISHDVEDEWTVDKAATPEENGIMSRHCRICGQSFDEIVFSYEEIGEDNAESSNPETDSSSTDKQSSTQTNDSTGNSPNKKPAINNTVGAKNPLSAVEGLKDYQEKYVQNLNPSQAEGESEIKPQKNPTDGKQLSFFTSITGAITLVICIVLSLGIIVLGVVLIIMNNKKSQQ